MSFCVYTLLIGDYETLSEQPVAASSNIPFICLTDNPALKSDTWTVVPVATAFPMDPIRSQRILKICPHRIPALLTFEHSLYIDNSVVLREAPEKFIGKLPMESGIGLPHHSFRHTVHDEFIEVARLGLDDQGRIFEQLNHYLAAGDATLDDAPFWTAILLRDHRNPEVQRAMEQWLSHVLRYSRRDQLSINTALRTAGLVPDRWEIDNHRSFFHTWPHTPGRERFAGTRSPRTSITPVPTQLVQARSALAATQRGLEAARRDVEELRQHIATQSSLLDGARREAEGASQRLEAQEHQHREAIRQRVEEAAGEALLLQQLVARAQQDTRTTLAAVHASSSWRITAPLRRVKRWLTG